jgi:putative transposase
MLKRDYSVKTLCENVGIQRSNYYYHKDKKRKRKLFNRRKKEKTHFKNIQKYFEDDPERAGKSGYRKVCLHLKNCGKPVYERATRKFLKEKGLQVCQSKSMQKWSSYKDDGNEFEFNWLYDRKTKKHFFSPKNVLEILSTDVTEFQVNSFKVYLSVVIDLHDFNPVTFKISKHPDKELQMGTLEDLVKKTGGIKSFILHSDGGCVYRSREWKSMCRKNHILQSMSRKGRSGDNAPVEGFFGILKQEWFNKKDFARYDYARFTKELEEYIRWFSEKREMTKLEGLSPIQYRKKMFCDENLGDCATMKGKLLVA